MKLSTLITDIGEPRRHSARSALLQLLLPHLTIDFRQVRLPSDHIQHFPPGEVIAVIKPGINRANELQVLWRIEGPAMMTVIRCPNDVTNAKNLGMFVEVGRHVHSLVSQIRLLLRSK